MAAILAAGDNAALSHASAAALWGIYPSGRRMAGAGLRPIHVSVPANRTIRLEGIEPHRRKQLPPTTTKGPIPLAQPLFTLVDLATTLGDRDLESAINEADKLGLLKPAHTKRLTKLPRTPGIGRLEWLLAAHKRTDSDLERDFLRLVRNAGLPRFDYEVEFWPVEVDSVAAPPPSKSATASATRHTQERDSRTCASSTHRSTPSPATSSRP